MEYVVVTGANGGLGYSLSKMLSEKGYFVYGIDIVGNRLSNIDNLKFIEFDLSNPIDIDNWVCSFEFR